MNRCVSILHTLHACTFFQAPRRRWLTLGAAALAGIALGSPTAAQNVVNRSFPAEALRGVLQIVDAPDSVLNGQPARLAPGARLRGPDNMLVMSAAWSGPRLVVNYTVDMLGLILNVWILRPDEAAQFWPRSLAEAARYDFDPVAQTWSKKP